MQVFLEKSLRGAFSRLGDSGEGIILTTPAPRLRPFAGSSTLFTRVLPGSNPGRLRCELG